MCSPHPAVRLPDFRPSQVGVGERGVFLRHRVEALDGIRQVLFIHILKKTPTVTGWEVSWQQRRAQCLSSEHHLGPYPSSLTFLICQVGGFYMI